MTPEQNAQLNRNLSIILAATPTARVRAEVPYERARPPMYVPDMDDQTGVVLNAIKNAPPVGALSPIERDVWA